MLRALCNYYDCLRRQEDSGLTPYGYSEKNANYNIVLSADGDLVDIIDNAVEKIVGKKTKKIGKSAMFPKRNSISGIAAETIDHREKYIFGFEKLVVDKNTGEKKLEITKNSLSAFRKCKEKNLEFTDGMTSEVVEAYRNFMLKWNPEEQTENKCLLALGNDYNGAVFVITKEGAMTKTLNSDPEVTAKWEALINSEEPDESAIYGQCSIEGSVKPLARTHDNLEGIKGGQASGTNIVCFNENAFESYGKTQAYNSSISESAMKKYTAAFNYISNSAQHKKTLDDMTLLFWAQTEENEDKYLKLMTTAIDGDNDENNGWGEYAMPETAPKGERERRSDAEQKIASVLRQLASGKTDGLDDLGVDSNTEFYILGLKPNASRLSIKLFEHNTFGKMMKNVACHIEDMSFSEEDRPLPIWAIAKQLKSPVSESDSVNPELSAQLLKSILCGYPYPRYMLDTVVRRARTDQDKTDSKDKKKNFYSVNPARARIIKACLTRNKYIERGEYDMLNEESTDTAYNLGRLFAVLEMVQKDALGDVNATIKDKFFSSACTTPDLVFPRLLRLTQPHLRKMDANKSIYREKQIQDIMCKLGNEFPKTLNTEKQGIFILGYYQQKQKLYEKKNNTEEENENE